MEAAADEQLERWKVRPMAHLREALEGRAALHPHCVFRYIQLPAEAKPLFPVPACKSVSSKGPALLRSIRAAARRRLGRLVTYAELLAMLDAEMARNAVEEPALDRATEGLMDSLRRGAIAAYGVPSDAQGDPRTGARHEPVPLTVLMGDNVTITLFDQITIEADIGEWMGWRRNAFHRVRFQTADVLALWPVEATLPAVTLEDLAADWTLMECVAWIMLRDLAVVRDTAPETARQPGTFYAEVRSPDGSTRMEAQTGAAGNTLLRLTAAWAAQLVETPAEVVWRDGDGREALLSALRSGRLRATGSSSSGTDRPMTPAHWRNVTLYEQPAGTLVVEPVRHGVRWWNVTVPRDVVVAIWPPRKTEPAAIAPPDVSDRTGVAGRPTSRHLVIAEYQRRHEADEALRRISEESRVLEAWLATAHPGLARMTARTIETAIRPEFRKHNPIRTK